MGSCCSFRQDCVGQVQRTSFELPQLICWRRFTNKITKVETLERPSACRGGLLADEMGMGKTLTVLALLVHSLDQATTFANARDLTDFFEETRQYSTRATLIITPKSSMILFIQLH